MRGGRPTLTVSTRAVRAFGVALVLIGVAGVLWLVGPRDGPRWQEVPAVPQYRPEMIWLPVRVGEGIERFALARTEVTQAQWRAVMGGNPSPHAGDDLPVHRVSLHAAMAYCNRLSALEGLASCFDLGGCTGDPNDGMSRDGFTCDIAQKIDGCTGYRLPSDFEWLQVSDPRARGSDESMLRVAWLAENSGDRPHPVGEKAPSPWGLMDVYGNAREWLEPAPPSNGVGLSPCGWQTPLSGCRGDPLVMGPRPRRGDDNGLRPARSIPRPAAD